MRIMVPSAGAASSVSVIKAARKNGHYVLATDINETAPGMLIATDCWTSKMCYEKEYMDEVLQVCKDEEIDFIIPINDAELPVYVQQRHRFDSVQTKLLMNPSRCVLDGHCKKRSWQVCEQEGIKQPLRHFKDVNLWQEVQDQRPPAECYPLIAKPCIGVGGRGQVICRNYSEIVQAVHSTDPVKLGNFIWQEYIDGLEYSVDCWGDPNTDQFVAVPRTRGKIINGQATGGVTVHAPDVVAFVRRICQAFGSNNVCCVQVLRDHAGELYFIEFNPRYGTGVSLSFEAGINFLALQFKQATGQAINDYQLTYEAGVGMARYWQEKFYRTEGNGFCAPSRAGNNSA